MQKNRTNIAKKSKISIIRPIVYRKYLCHMKSKLLLLTTVILLTSCTTPTSGPTGTGSTTILPNTTITDKVQSSGTTPIVESGSQRIPTPTYGTGKMQVEEFADFECPACIQFNKVVLPILEQYAKDGKMTITYRQYPLTMHKNAMGDALAALCSAEQGKYMQYKDGLYALEASKNHATVTDDDRIALAKSLGMDTTKFTSCLTTKVYQTQVNADMARGDTLGVTGTPTTFIDGVKLDMSLFKDVPSFQSWLESRMK